MSRSPLAETSQNLWALSSTIDSMQQAVASAMQYYEGTDAAETACLEKQLVAQAVEFERRRERLRAEVLALRERNHILERILVDTGKQVRNGYEASLMAFSITSMGSTLPPALQMPPTQPAARWPARARRR